jgi:YHS domain-containing protein
MNAITIEQIEFLRNKLPEIVKQFNEKNNCNTKIFQWIKLTKVEVNNYNGSSYKIESNYFSIDDLFDLSVEKLEFSIGFILVDDKWMPVFEGDTLYHGTTEVKVYESYRSALKRYPEMMGIWEVNCKRNHNGLDIEYFKPLSKLTFQPVPERKAEYYTIIYEDEVISIPRPIKNELKEFGVSHKKLFASSCFGRTYYFFNEEDRNKFNVTVDNFLESLKANYK